jgi:hypothetical protein
MRESRGVGTRISTLTSMALMYRVEKPLQQQNRIRLCNDFYIKMNQAIALSAGLIEASSPLTSAAGLGGLNR